MYTLALLVLPLLFSTSAALTAPLTRHSTKRHEWPSNTHFLSSASKPFGIPLKNADDVIYSVGITLGGQELTVLVDTGSSDLWIKDTSVHVIDATNVSAAISYARGEISGSVAFADLTLGGFTVLSQAFIDAENGFSVNGRSFPLASGVPSVPTGKALVVLDTGFSLPPIPEPMVDYIYGSIPGAVKLPRSNSSDTLWLVPCRGTTNLTFAIGGEEVPIHPLDLTLVLNKTLAGRNITFCTNRYRANSDLATTIGIDMILGDAFLRNTYVSFDYGTFDEQGILTETPFVQILPTTQFSEALPEFISVREKVLQSMPEEIAPSEFIELAALEVGSNSTASTPNTPKATGNSTILSANLETSPASLLGTDAESGDSMLNKYAPIVIGLLGANVFVVLVLCILAVYFLVAARRDKNATQIRALKPDYRPLKLDRGLEEHHGHSSGISGPYDA
ncbi:hypothetical protein HGRIS_014367 [Hohenbuehelia grisea]|uniref:Peptidase A1 domain-containing protein n=1 Tax=Hohenbuehelia grisea TaxID=104357 RepID=A0ABR3JTG0_9AGAR